MEDLDRSDELREIWAEDALREKMRQNGQEPDDPGPEEPPPQDECNAPQDNGAGVMCVRPATSLDGLRRKRWLAKGRIPFRDVTVLVGDEGIGKSLFWVLIVACVTTGSACSRFGIPAREAADVLLILTEDDWSTDVLPRLKHAGADISRISVLCDSPDGSGSPDFPRYKNLVLQAIPTPALVVVDAWLDTVDPRLMVRNPQQARQALHPWRSVAIQKDCSVLLLSHTNRLDSGDTRDLYGASATLRQKARMTLFAQNDTDGFLTIGPDKANSTQGGTLATCFTIKKIQADDPTNEDDGTVPLLQAVGYSTKTAREIALANHIAQQSGSDASDEIPAHLEEFADALREFIAGGEPCPPGWLPNGRTGHRRLSAEVFKAVEAMGASKDKAKRVKSGIGAFAKHSDDDKWYWVIADRQRPANPHGEGDGEDE